MPTPTKGPRLGGSPAHEQAIIANLARALFEHGRITTTLTKAKRLRPRAEHLITFAKKGDLASRRQVLRVVRDKDVVYKLFDEIAPRFADRQGGYTRILKLGPRHGDNAPMALIELVEQGTAVAEAEATTAEPTRRRRFGRRRDAQEAPAGANRAQRRAAARGKLAPTPEHDHEDEEAVAEAAEAEAEAEDSEDRPAVPTDQELAAGATPVVEEDDLEEDLEEDEEGDDEADGDQDTRVEADADAEAEADEEPGEDPRKR